MDKFTLGNSDRDKTRAERRSHLQSVLVETMSHTKEVSRRAEIVFTGLIANAESVLKFQYEEGMANLQEIKDDMKAICQLIEHGK